MRRRLVMGGVALLLAGGVGARVASAAAPEAANGKYTPAAAAAQPEGTVTVDGDSMARVLVHVDGQPNGRIIKRSRGVQAVTNPAPGRFCLRPSVASGVSPSNTVPIVSTEYIGTSGFDGFAQWNASRQGCPGGTFAINTFDASEARPLNDVSFTVVVP